MIKMPFKQVPVVTMNNDYRIENDLVDPSEDLRLTTAFTVKRVRNGLRRLPQPIAPPNDNGRLLKAKLRPLRPVNQSRGPAIYTCEGIQPEHHKPKDRPSPSRLRHLKDQYLELCKIHRQQIEDEETEELNTARLVSGAGSAFITAPSPVDMKAVDESLDCIADPLLSPQREHIISIPEVPAEGEPVVPKQQ